MTTIKPGDVVGRLTVIDVVEKRNGGIAIVRCSCGNEFFCPASKLTGKVRRLQSCGCLRADACGEAAKNRQATYRQFGTNIALVKSDKISRNNTSGFKGVSFDKNCQKYEAYISVNGKKKRLGLYKDIAQAVAAREDAFEKYYQPKIDEYNAIYGEGLQ